MSFKIFVINLERCKEKREKMIKKLEGEEYEMTMAVDGKELNKDTLKALDVELLKQWKDPWSGRNITWGEVGCSLSHYNIYKYCVENNIENAVILEDDIDIPEKLSNSLDNIIDNLNKEISNWELCYLSRKPINSEKENVNEFKDFVKVDYSYWTCSYIINLKGMQKIINSNYHKNIIPADEILPILGNISPHKDYYKYYNIQEPLNIYSVKNMICYPEGNAFEKSDTENSKIIEMYEDDLLVLATGTDMTDGLKRFINSCKIYGLKHKIMGLNTQWKGGNMADGPGGGQKINFLLKTLDDLNDDQIILVTDSYDVIMSANSKEIIEKYKSFNKNIVFASESACWPDRNKAKEFPKILGKRNLYLNSGGFIGDVKSIKKIVSTVPSNSDDQRWYTQMFLSESGKKYMTLDYDCKIFQCLNDAEIELEINDSKSRIYNKINKTFPCQIHGNGGPDRKLLLNKYENYLMRNWTSVWGYNKNNDKKIDTLDSITIYIQFFNENNITSKNNKIIVEQNIDELKKIINNVKVIYSKVTDLNEGLREAFAFDNIDYYWFIDIQFIITNKNTLIDLITRNKGIISPIMTKPNLLWSNFWGSVCPNGWYNSSFDYIDIVNNIKKGCWNVPHLSGNILINKEYIEKVQDFFTNNNGNVHFSTSMWFTDNCRKNNISMYATNMEYYGYIFDNKEKTNTKKLSDEIINKSLFLYESDPDWAVNYLHPDFLKSIGNWDNLPVEEPCKWTFTFPFVNEKFCDELLNEVEERGNWSPGNDTQEKDKRINNVENVPTQDIHMKEIGFREQWNNIVKTYIAPLVSHLYSPFKTMGLNIAFVVKYEMGHQQELNAHHDSSSYSINIALNTQNVDFTGGGTRFIKQDTTVQGKKGWVIIHPGRLTHYHEGLPITSGKRFIFVSFVN